MAVDTIWVLLAAILIFMMQMGFAMVEAGFTRAKNTANILMKNLLDFCFGTILFWILGYYIMFGPDGLFGLIGNPFGGTQSPDNIPALAFVVFQTMFCATTATIVSGAGSRAHLILGVFHLLHSDKCDSLPRIGALDLGRRLGSHRSASTISRARRVVHSLGGCSRS